MCEASPHGQCGRHAYRRRRPSATQSDASYRGHGRRDGLRAPAHSGAPAVGAARISRPRRGGPDQRPGRGPRHAPRRGQGDHLAGQRRRALDPHRGRGDRAGDPAALAACDLPAGRGRGRAGARPGAQVAGRPAPSGGGASGRLRQREQLPQRAFPRLDRLLRGLAPGLGARDARPVAPRLHRRDRGPDRPDRDQPDPARRALHLRRAGRLGPRHHLAGPHRLRLRADPAGRRAAGDRSGHRGSRA